MRTLTALMLAALLTGCGSSGSGSEDYKDLDAVAAAAQCKTYTGDDDPMMFAAESGSCTLDNGDDVALNWFNNNDARDKYLKVGIEMGAVYVVGDKWVAECDTTDTQAAVAKTTKGEMKG